MEGNQIKMREAIETAIQIMRNCPFTHYKTTEVDAVAEMMERSISAPPRQCDVGTAEEQAERMRLYCNSHGEDESGCFRCDKCPFLTDERCELAWAQMPYEEQEGGAS